MKTIVLTGMMGSGKTTLGKLLGETLNMKFIDIDSSIELSEKSSIKNIFEIKGEKYFRELEKQTIKTIFKPEDLIIALGGGAFENNITRKFLLNNALIIYLKTTPQTIFDRIQNDTIRPLLCGKMNIEKIKEIIKIREKNYESAHLTISTDNKTLEEIIEEITGVLE